MLLVHGIGSNIDSQVLMEEKLHASFKKVTQGKGGKEGYFDSAYQIVTHVVDWKSEVEQSGRFGQRLKRVTIPSSSQYAKNMFDYTVPDTMAFFNPCFLPRILESVSNQMNKIVTKLAVEEPRFRGKVSIIGHSLGTVISYDLLTRQKW